MISRGYEPPPLKTKFGIGISDFRDFFVYDDRFGFGGVKIAFYYMYFSFDYEFIARLS